MPWITCLSPNLFEFVYNFFFFLSLTMSSFHCNCNFFPRFLQSGEELILFILAFYPISIISELINDTWHQHVCWRDYDNEVKLLKRTYVPPIQHWFVILQKSRISVHNLWSASFCLSSPARWRAKRRKGKNCFAFPKTELDEGIVSFCYEKNQALPWRRQLGTLK